MSGQAYLLVITDNAFPKSLREEFSCEVLRSLSFRNKCNEKSVSPY